MSKDLNRHAQMLVREAEKLSVELSRRKAEHRACVTMHRMLVHDVRTARQRLKEISKYQHFGAQPH